MRVSRRVAATLLVVSLAACTGSAIRRPAAPPSTTATTATSAPPTTSPSPTSVHPVPTAACARPHPSGQSADHFDFAGQRRTYQLYVPASYDGTRPVPVVFEFHGYSSNAFQQVFYGDFRPLADRDGFLIVAPDGQGAVRHFNLSGEPGLQDDVAMVGALLDHIKATMCVDTARVFAAGMSDGGAMSSILACRDADRFAAFGAVAVVVYLPGCGNRPVAIAAFAGTADPIVPFNGGRVACCGYPSLAGAPQSVAGWAQHDGCAAAPTVDRLGSEVERRTWTACAGGAVVFYVIDGGGHTWPGAIPLPFLGLTTHQISASETLWAFFQAHPLHR